MANPYISSDKIIAFSSIIENAPYMASGMQTQARCYSLKCASSQSTNCGTRLSLDKLFSLKCASSQSQNCSRRSNLESDKEIA